MSILEYFEKISAFPEKQYLVRDDNDVIRLDFDYIINKLNEIFGADKWKSTFRCDNNDGANVFVCELSVKAYNEEWITQTGIVHHHGNTGLQEAMMDAFRWAAASHGNIFGKQLKVQFEER